MAKIVESGQSSALSDMNVKTLVENDGTLEITISQMYDYVDVTFEHLEEITKLCGSKRLNIGEREHNGGCETCDYGSSYKLPLYVMDPKIQLEGNPNEK